MLIIVTSTSIITSNASTSSDVSLDLLCTISSVAPSHVSDNTLPLLFSALPDRAPPRDAEAERIRYWRTLASLKKLCTQPDLFETLVVRLSTKLDLLCSPSAQTRALLMSCTQQLKPVSPHSQAQHRPSSHLTSRAVLHRGYGTTYLPLSLRGRHWCTQRCLLWRKLQNPGGLKR